MKKICLAIAAFALAGCATSPETTAWNMAREVNTSAGYQHFVDRYPDSGHLDEAREMVGTSKMEQIHKMETVAECISVMKTNPDPKTAATVADLAYKAALKETSVESLYDFLTCFKGHSGITAVQTRLEDLEFKGASKEISPEAMEYFLFKYPQSRFAAEGRRLLAEKSYKQVMEWNNQFGFKAFIQKFPESPHAAAVRKSIKSYMSPLSPSNDRTALPQTIEKSPWLKKYRCALALSSEIKKKSGNVDSLRRSLYDLEKGGTSRDLPEVCSSLTVAVRSGNDETLNDALKIMASAEDLRKELANHWKTYGQRSEMSKSAINASSKVADELEAAELSEDVLGSGPLGGLDVGREKGSVSARKALERFSVAEKAIAKDRQEIKRLLLQTDAQYRPLQNYISNYLVAE